MIMEIWLSWLIRILLVVAESLTGPLVYVSHPATCRDCQFDKSLSHSVEYSAYFSWQNIGTASVGVGFVLHRVALGKFILPECQFFSVYIVTLLFYGLSSITDALTSMQFSTSLNNAEKKLEILHSFPLPNLKFYFV
jgi:hypothetical protein